jgi:hypothetical protein
MQHIRIKTVTEDDFDEVITSAGGSRISEDGSADYRLNEAIIELKLVSEEGFEKVERQKKLATLFREMQPNHPVVLINPGTLNELGARSYCRIVETPIKSHCKKASKQLQLTAERFNPPPTRVLVILNVGYTLLSSDEFKDVCFKCVRNDTTGIDWVMCGGIYFYSDKFDNYVIAPLEEMALNLSRPVDDRRDSESDAIYRWSNAGPRHGVRFGRRSIHQGSARNATIFILAGWRRAARK